MSYIDYFAVSGMVLLSVLIMYSAQAYVGFISPKIDECKKFKKYKSIRKFSVKYNSILGVFYLILSISGLYILSNSQQLICIILSVSLLSLSVLALVIRIIWSFL